MRVWSKQTGSICCAVLFFLLACAFLPPAFAYAKIDTRQTAALTVVAQREQTPIAGLELQLYRVASVTENGAFRVLPAFEGAQVSLPANNAAETWSARALTLEAYLIARAAEGNPLTATASAVTNEKGVAVFPKLETGLYLLVGNPQRVGQQKGILLTTLLSLPQWRTDGKWEYSPTIQGKLSVQPRSEESISLSAIKIWQDAGNEAQRPAEVTVTLYGDGIEYSTVKLNSTNDWRHTWKDLNGNVRWHLVEKDLPAAYTVTVVQDGTAFVVTNTFQDTPSPKPPPTFPTIPQTGQLWWPVSLLALCGLALFLTGVILCKKGRKPYEP